MTHPISLLVLSGPAPGRARARSGRAAPAELLGALLAALALAIALLGVGAPGAHAHDQLLRSSPADGAQLDAAPSEWSLTFSANVLDVGAELAVLDGAGAPLEIGEPVVSGPTVKVALPDMEPGAYTGQWRVVSSDGHPVSGTVSFTVLEGAAGAAGQPATTGPDAQESGQPVVSPAATPGEAAPAGALPAWAGWALGALGLLAIIAAAAAMLGRMRRGDAPARDAERAPGGAHEDPAADDTRHDRGDAQS